MRDFLGSVYRSELAARVELGRLDGKAHAQWRAERKQASTGLSSRWAGAITRTVEAANTVRAAQDSPLPINQER